MERYFVTHIKNEVLDVNAHNKKEQKVIKHPVKDKWAVRVLPGNRYIEAKLAGTVVSSLSGDWFARAENNNN